MEDHNESTTDSTNINDQVEDEVQTKSKSSEHNITSIKEWNENHEQEEEKTPYVEPRRPVTIITKKKVPLRVHKTNEPAPNTTSHQVVQEPAPQAIEKPVKKKKKYGKTTAVAKKKKKEVEIIESESESEGETETDESEDLTDSESESEEEENIVLLRKKKHNSRSQIKKQQRKKYEKSRVKKTKSSVPQEVHKTPEVTNIKTKFAQPGSGDIIPTQLGKASQILHRAEKSMYDATSTTSCGSCGKTVATTQTYIRYECGHFAHTWCAHKTNMIITCPVCDMKQRENRENGTLGYSTSLSIIDGIEVPQPNADHPYQIIAGFDMSDLRALYTLTREKADECKEQDKVPVKSSEDSIEFAKTYGNTNATRTELKEEAGLEKLMKSIMAPFKRKEGNSYSGDGMLTKEKVLNMIYNNHETVRRMIDEYGINIEDIKMANVTIDQWKKCGYSILDLFNLKATVDDLILMGLADTHLNVIDAHYLVNNFKLTQKQVYDYIFNSQWLQIAVRETPADVLAMFGMDFMWLQAVGVDPHGWSYFKYIEPKDFKTHLKFTREMFLKYPDQSRLCSELNWSDSDIAEVFQCIRKSSQNKISSSSSDSISHTTRTSLSRQPDPTHSQSQPSIPTTISNTHSNQNSSNSVFTGNTEQSYTPPSSTSYDVPRNEPPNRKIIVKRYKQMGGSYHNTTPVHTLSNTTTTQTPTTTTTKTTIYSPFK